MNTYSTTNGERYTTEEINRKMKKAKAELLDEQRQIHGYNFCIKCKNNDCKPVDCSHDISVKWAKENGQAELCWDKSNMEPVGRNCHKIKDKLNLQFTNKTTDK
jgi:hypothetical protein